MGACLVGSIDVVSWMVGMGDILLRVVLPSCGIELGLKCFVLDLWLWFYCDSSVGKGCFIGQMVEDIMRNVDFVSTPFCVRGILSKYSHLIWGN